MKKTLVIISILLIITIITGCSQQASTGNGDKPSTTQEKNKENTPIETFETFVQGIKTDDYKAVWDVLSEKSKSEFKENGQPSYEKFKKEISRELDSPEKKEEITSAVPVSVTEMAEVKIKYKKGDEEKEEKIKMIKEDGKWKIYIR